MIVFIGFFGRFTDIYLLMVLKFAKIRNYCRNFVNGVGCNHVVHLLYRLCLYPRRPRGQRAAYPARHDFEPETPLRRKRRALRMRLWSLWKRQDEVRRALLPRRHPLYLVWFGESRSCCRGQSCSKIWARTASGPRWCLSSFWR